MIFDRIRHIIDVYRIRCYLGKAGSTTEDSNDRSDYLNEANNLIKNAKQRAFMISKKHFDRICELEKEVNSPIWAY